MTPYPVALIVDIVKSRELVDRAGAQRDILTAFRAADDARNFREPLWATAGDEFQAVFDTAADALRATAIAQLLLPDGLECRFGLGQGEITAVDAASEQSRIQDGPAWWVARQAINEAHRREDRSNPYLRTWFISAESADAADAVINSYLLVRDQTISTMNARQRRLAAGALLGRSQSDLAKDEGITQSAVSQNLQRSGGAALVAAHSVLDEVSAR